MSLRGNDEGQTKYRSEYSYIETKQTTGVQPRSDFTQCRGITTTSSMLFCIGVPVNKSLNCTLNCTQGEVGGT